MLENLVPRWLWIMGVLFVEISLISQFYALTLKSYFCFVFLFFFGQWECRQKKCKPPGRYSFLLLCSALVPGAWSGLCLPPSWVGQKSHLNSRPAAVSHSRWPGGSSRPVLSPGTLTQRPSLLVLGPPQLVWLVPGLALEQCLAAWSLAMPGTHLWSSSSSPMPFWALPCLRPWGSSVWWSPSLSSSPCEASWRSPTRPCCFDSKAMPGAGVCWAWPLNTTFL